MNFTSLVSTYPKKRMLTEQERRHHLRQKKRLALEPHYQLSIIKMNSTFMDSVDRWFGWKGLITAASLLLICMFGYGGVTMAFAAGPVSWGNMNADEKLEQIIFSCVIFSISLPPILIGIWGLRKESFAYTHFPIRFNYKTQMVHVFRADGSVLSAPWNEIFFTLGHLPVANDWEVRGHIMESDNVTIRESFALSYYGSISPVDLAAQADHISSTDFVRAHWEFVRRYMEDGPQSVSNQVQFCMPIDKRRESVRISLERTFANISGAPILVFLMLVPYCTIAFLFRLIAVRTSKIPVWPDDIEASSKVEPGDPFAIEGTPKGDRMALFPEAALAAGVGFRPKACPETTNPKT